MSTEDLRKRKSTGLSKKQEDDIFASFVEKKGEETTKKEESKNMMKKLQDQGPTYVFAALCVAVVLLTIGGSFYEEPQEEQSHYTTLGIKRMCKADEIKISYDKLTKEVSGDNLDEVKDAYKTLSNPRSRRTYDRATPATREELYYKAVKYIGESGDLQWSAVASGKSPYLVEVHSGAHRLPRHASIHTMPPNWGRFMTKTSKMLRSAVQLGRINVDAEPELATKLGLLASNMPKMPYLMAVTGSESATCGLATDPKIGAAGGCRAYKGEARILKIADFLGEGISMGSTQAVTYGTVDNWKKTHADRVKVLLFRKSFTAMVLAFREAADELEGFGFQFGEVDVRSRGAVNLWRRFNLRRLPLIAVLRDDDAESPVYGGQLGTKTLENWLMINKNPSLPRISSDNLEEKCLYSKRYCAILGVDATHVAYARINETLRVFMSAQQQILKHPSGKEIEFVWADKISEHHNTTEMWKSLTTVFSMKDADRKAESLVVTDNYYGTFKSFGGNLAKVTDMTGKDEEMHDFIKAFVEQKKGLRTEKLPSPIFTAPPPPPYTQEDITKIFVVAIVGAAAIASLMWSYMTFKKEEAIREELKAASTKKIKKEKRDNEYSTGED